MYDNDADDSDEYNAASCTNTNLAATSRITNEYGKNKRLSGILSRAPFGMMQQYCKSNSQHCLVVNDNLNGKPVE